MSHAHQGGQAPDQASSGRQTGAAAHTRTDHSQGTHTAASPLTSHTRHGDNQAGNGPRQTNPPTLTVMHGAGDVRIENVPDARLLEPSDAVVRVTHAGICGSDLWPYKTMEPSETGRRMGHEFIGVVEAVGGDVQTVKAGDLVISPFLGVIAAAWRAVGEVGGVRAAGVVGVLGGLLVAAAGAQLYRSAKRDQMTAAIAGPGSPRVRS